MPGSDFPVSAYLDRVGLTGPPPVSESGLAQVHRAQLLQIPFENLDILLGRGVDVAPDAVAAKLIDRRRGGYCFELNGLYCRALRALGFDARLLLARVVWGAENVPPRTHALNLVRWAGHRCISDVGFGAHSMRMPLALEDGCESESYGQRLKLCADEEFGWRLLGWHEGAWQPHYVFDLAPVYPADIALSNHWTSTGSHSHFTRIATVSRITADGRITLRDGLLTRYRGGRTEREMACRESLPGILRNDFELELKATPAEMARLWGVIDGEHPSATE